MANNGLYTEEISPGCYRALGRGNIRYGDDFGISPEKETKKRAKARQSLQSQFSGAVTGIVRNKSGAGTMADKDYRKNNWNRIKEHREEHFRGTIKKISGFRSKHGANSVTPDVLENLIDIDIDV